MQTCEIERATTVVADPGDVHELVNDFRAWQEWAPWEEPSDRVARTYSGPEDGVGSNYAWRGNWRLGSGRMEILRSEPDVIDIALSFRTPWPSRKRFEFRIDPVADGTRVVWRMRCRRPRAAALVGRIVPMDKMMARYFELGLARLKARAEATV